MNKEICTNIENLYTSMIYPDCPKKHLCDSGQYNFSKKPKMPYIGREYGNNPKIPNLLFISLDSGDEKENLHTIEEIRNAVESEHPRVDPGKDLVKHWYQTFDIAALLLNKYFDDSAKNNISYVDSYIAHTNSAKCTQNKNNRAQADGNVFENCHGFVVEEIPLFNADIIITQGIPSQNCLSSYLASEKIVLESNHEDWQLKLPIYIREKNTRKVLHIPMYHPSYYKRYWGQKQVIKDSLQIIIEILERLRN